MLVKNTYGCSAVLGTSLTRRLMNSKYSGSSLDRKKQVKTKPKKQELSEEKNAPTEKEQEKDATDKVRVMSSRTKTKIRKKLYAFSRISNLLTFVTLTFVNEVTDEQAIQVLRKFVDNMKKRRV